MLQCDNRDIRVISAHESFVWMKCGIERMVLLSNFVSWFMKNVEKFLQCSSWKNVSSGFERRHQNHNNDSNNTRFRLIEAHLNISITCFSLQLMLNPAESLFNWQKKTTLNDSVNVLSNHLFHSIVMLLINLKLFHFRPRWQYKTSKWAFVCWTKLS